MENKVLRGKAEQGVSEAEHALLAVLLLHTGLVVSAKELAQTLAKNANPEVATFCCNTEWNLQYFTDTRSLNQSMELRCKASY